MVTIDCIGKNVAVTGGSKTEVQVSSMCSGSAEYRMGVPDAGTLAIGGFWKIEAIVDQAAIEFASVTTPKAVVDQAALEVATLIPAADTMLPIVFIAT